MSYLIANVFDVKIRQELRDLSTFTPNWPHQSAGEGRRTGYKESFHPLLMLLSSCRSKALEVVEGESVCRWCSNQGVDGLSCVKCDASFCRKVYLPSFQPVKLGVISQCLNVNLGAGFIKLASASEGDWTCLLCKSAPLEKFRSSLLAPLQVGHE